METKNLLNLILEEKHSKCTVDGLKKLGYSTVNIPDSGNMPWKDEVACVIAGTKPLALTHFDTPKDQWDDEIADIAAECGLSALIEFEYPVNYEPGLIKGSIDPFYKEYLQNNGQWKEDYDKSIIINPSLEVGTLIWYRPGTEQEADAILLRKMAKTGRHQTYGKLYDMVQAIVYGYNPKPSYFNDIKVTEYIELWELAQAVVIDWRKIYEKNRQESDPCYRYKRSGDGILQRQKGQREALAALKVSSKY